MVREAFGRRAAAPRKRNVSKLESTYHLSFGSFEQRSAAEDAFEALSAQLAPDEGADLLIESRQGQFVIRRRLYGTRFEVEEQATELGARLPDHEVTAVTDQDRVPEFGAVELDLFAYTAPVPSGTVLASPGEMTPPDFPAATPDSELRGIINEHVQQLRGQSRVADDEQTAWFVYSLTDDVTLAAINADVRLQAASMMKPFVALAYFHEVEAGRLEYDESARLAINLMMTKSRNRETNVLMERLGGPDAIQDLLQSEYGHLLSDVEIVETIPSSGATYRNLASARDYGRFCWALYHQQVPGSAEILGFMEKARFKRIRNYASAMPNTLTVMNKTGTTSRMIGDFGIVYGRRPDRTPVPYVIVAIVHKEGRYDPFTEFSWRRGKEVIGPVSSLVYQHVRAKYGLA